MTSLPVPGGRNPDARARKGVRVAVIGGGLAGITAAIALAESGADVTLLEARPRLGGATCSFSRDGLTVDTGQHVFLGCCTAYRGAAGPARHDRARHAAGPVRRDRPRPGADGRPRKARLRRTALPGPLHMLPALAGIRFFLSPNGLSVARPALAMRFVNPADPAADTQRFGDWLAERGQGERTRRALWDLFSVSALNIAGDDASLALAAVVVQDRPARQERRGRHRRPRAPAGRAARRRGRDPAGQARRPGRPEHQGRSRPSSRSRAAASASQLAQGDPMTADAVVLAVPHEKAAPLIPAGALPEQTVAGWAGLGASPIVNVHVIYDRPVMDLPFVAAIDSPVQWVFDRTRISGLRPGPGAAVPGHLAVGRGPVRGHPGRAAARAVPARAGRTVPGRARRPGHRILRHPRAAGDVPPGTGQRRAAAEGRDRPAGPGAGRRVDRHRLAGHDGGRRAQRPGCGGRAAPYRAHFRLNDRGTPSDCCNARGRGPGPGPGRPRDGSRDRPAHPGRARRRGLSPRLRGRRG